MRINFFKQTGPGWLNELGSWIAKQLIQAFHQYGVDSRPALQITKGCTRLAAASDKAYQLLAHGLFFSPGTPASHTTKTGPQNTKNQKNQINTSADELLVAEGIFLLVISA